MEIDELVASLKGRVQAFYAGDRVPLLDTAGRDEAFELYDRAAAPDGGIALDVLQVIADYHFTRAVVLPEDQRTDDVKRAMRLYAVLVHDSPERVPERLRADLLKSEPAKLMDPSAIMQRMTDGAATADEVQWLITRLTARYGSPTDDHEQAVAALDLAAAHLHRFERAGDVADLDRVLVIGQEAAALPPPDPLWLADLQSRIAAALTHRYGHTHRLDDLEAAVAAAHFAVDNGRIEHLQGLAWTLARRERATGSFGDLDESVAHSRRLIAALQTDGRPVPHIVYSQLGGTLGRLVIRFRDSKIEPVAARRDRVEADLRDAVSAYQAAIAVAGGDEEARRRYSSALDLLTGSTVRTASTTATFAVGPAAPGHGPAPQPTAPGPVTLLLRATVADDRAALDQAIAQLYAAVQQPAPGADREAHATDLARGLRMRFERTGAITDLDAAIRHGGQSVQYTPAAHPELPPRHGELAAALLVRYRHLGNAADLQAAAEHTERAVHLAGGPAHPRWAELRSTGAAILGERFVRTGSPVDIAAALDAHREALAGTPGRHPLRPAHLDRYAVDLLRSAEHTGSVADTEPASAACREAVALAAAGHPDRGVLLARLSQTLQARSLRTRAPADRAEAEPIARQAVLSTPAGHPARGPVMIRHAMALALRHEDNGHAADLDEALAAARAAVAVPAGPIPGAGCLRRLAVIVHERHQQMRDPATLDEALRSVRAAIGRVPPDHPERVAAVGDLGVILLSAVSAYGRPEDIDEAVRALDEAAASPVTGPSIQLAFLEAKTIALMKRFDATNDPAAIEEALGVTEVVLARTPPDHPAYSSRLTRKADLLLRRAVRLGDRQDQEIGITALRAAVAAAPTGSLERHRLGGKLAAALLRRFQEGRDRADLTEAVTLARAAVTAYADSRFSDPDRRIIAQSTLAEVLTEYAKDSSEPAGATALAEAEAATRAAVGSSAKPPADSWEVLSVVLLAKADRHGDAAALHEGVNAARRAAGAAPTSPTKLQQVGRALRQRYELLGDGADLRAALDAARRALQVIAGDHPERHLYLHDLGDALLDAGEAADSRQLLDEGVERYREAVATTAGGPDYAEALVLLGAALWRRDDDPGPGIEHFRAALAERETLNGRIALTDALLDTDGTDPDELGEPLARLQEGLHTVPASDPRWQHAKYTIGRVLERRDDSQRAAESYRQAVAAGSRALVTRAARLQLARCTVRLHGPAEALGVYAEIIDDWETQTWRGARLVDHQHRFPVQYTTAGREAASCAIAAGDPERAVDLLERSRSMLWQQVLDTNVDLAALHRAAPELAATLLNSRTVLDSALTDADARMHAARTFDLVVTRIRALPPSQDLPDPAGFLARRPVAQLLPVLGAGTMVIVNISALRCDALLLTATGVCAVELPGLDQDDVNQRCVDYIGMLEQPGTVHRFNAEMAITDTLNWLWDHLAGPIMAALPATQDRPRVWWSPTGLLGVLPLHAAGYHEEPGRSVLDTVRSSYTPTLRALADRVTREPVTVGDLFTVELAETPQWPDLPQARRELAYLADLHLTGERTTLSGPAAGRVAMLEHLYRSRWLHAACHGTQDMFRPAEGGLVPYDWTTQGLVTIRDASRARTNGEFAFLSACKTAVGGTANVDEAITVAAALQAAGWRHVIATLWTIPDESAAEITRTVYDRLVRDGALHPDDAADALDHAVRALRDKAALVPSRWAMFIHTGP